MNNTAPCPFPWCAEVFGFDDTDLDDRERVGELMSEHYQTEHPLELELVYLSMVIR